MNGDLFTATFKHDAIKSLGLCKNSQLLRFLGHSPVALSVAVGKTNSSGLCPGSQWVSHTRPDGDGNPARRTVALKAGLEHRSEIPSRQAQCPVFTKSENSTSLFYMATAEHGGHCT